MLAILPELWETERLQTAKVTQGHRYRCHSIGHVRFILVFHCSYVTILYRFRDITYFPKFRRHVTLNTPSSAVICHACVRTHHDQSAYQNFKCLDSPIPKTRWGLESRGCDHAHSAVVWHPTDNSNVAYLCTELEDSTAAIPKVWRRTKNVK